MPIFFAVSLLSAAAIGYEILLMRLLSIVQWHHFAYMIISVALLGYGAAGSFVALAQEWLGRHFTTAFAAGAAAFALSAVGGFALAQRLPFNALELPWGGAQIGYLVALYLLLAVPFFCAASALVLAFVHFKGRIGTLYRFDLMGAGCGAVAIVALLYGLAPPLALKAIAALGFVAAATASLHHGGRPGRRAVTAALILAGAILPIVAPQSWLAPRPSEYKGLRLALNAPDAAVIAERSSPLGWLTVVESPTIPFRHAPGLSLMVRQEPPEQLGVFSDGDSLSPITRFDGDLAALAYLDGQTAALPYHLLVAPKVLILGAGGGADVLLAKYHQAARIDAVELNPQMAGLVTGEFADFSGNLYDSPGVRLHLAEARSFVARSTEHYDLIQLALLDSFSAAAAGVFALNESTLYTREAFAAYLAHLRPGGLVALTRWLKLPPRDALKLLATAAAVLRRAGVAEPGRQIALIRGWKTTTLLLKNGAFTAAERAAIREFAAARAFDLAYLPGMGAAEANRYNVLRAPEFFQGATALLGPQREQFLDDYKFALAPASDDRPYFFHFLKWRALPELAAMRAGGGLGLVDWGYVVLVATLIQAALAGLVLILGPLWAGRAGRRLRGAAPGQSRIVLYFVALGLAFLAIEIAFIQRFVLFLGHPLYAIAVVLAAFLVFAGLGSGVAQGLARRARAGQDQRGWARRMPVAIVVAAIAALGAVYLGLLPALFDWLRPWPEAARIAVSVALIAPLAFLMGMPFPLGLSRVAAEAPALVPWAWGVNACASVLSAVGATLLAIHAGFTVVVACALVLYAVAALVYGGAAREAPRSPRPPASAAR